jgi:predicted enzyme related to lactoylglutathione lyase
MRSETCRHYLIVCLLAGSLSLKAQSIPFQWRPAGSAIVVSNIENSVHWYRSVFGANVKTKMDDSGNTVVILEAQEVIFELMQLKNSVPRTEALKAKAQGSQIEGHFKICFAVTDIDACLRHLKKLNIEVPRVWTDSSTGKRNFLITDPDGNHIQFFD